MVSRLGSQTTRAVPGAYTRLSLAEPISTFFYWRSALHIIKVSLFDLIIMSKTFAVCREPCKSMCSRYQVVAYCSIEHQAQDWSSGHRRVCVSPPAKVEDLFNRLFFVLELDLPDNAIYNMHPLLLNQFVKPGVKSLNASINRASIRVRPEEDGGGDTKQCPWPVITAAQLESTVYDSPTSRS